MLVPRQWVLYFKHILIIRFFVAPILELLKKENKKRDYFFFGFPAAKYLKIKKAAAPNIISSISSMPG
jgi:hypothetical protein